MEDACSWRFTCLPLKTSREEMSPTNSAWVRRLPPQWPTWVPYIGNPGGTQATLRWETKETLPWPGDTPFNTTVARHDCWRQGHWQSGTILLQTTPTRQVNCQVPSGTEWQLSLCHNRTSLRLCSYFALSIKTIELEILTVFIRLLP